jgi:hypothetical protein
MLRLKTDEGRASMITADASLNQQITSHGTRPAFDAYLRARRRGWLAQQLAKLAGRSRRLLPLEDAGHAEPAGQRSAGLQAIPLRAIRGSEGRSRDFDVDFNPLTEHTQERWIRLYNAWQDGEHLPPVALLRVGDTYYVRDGHHRLSIARSLGQEYVEAEVTVRE